MFGIFRFLLAFCVLLTHIAHIEIVAGQAVYGFFILSGFLMTGVLQKKYGFSNNGFISFSLSRIIRLYPTYWLTCVLMAAMIFIYHILGGVGDAQNELVKINHALGVPSSFRDWFSTIFIVGHTVFGLTRIEHALSPSAWAIDVEILMYICSFYYLSRSERNATYVLIILSILYPAFWYLSKKMLLHGFGSELSNQMIYSFLPSALLPYTAGCYLYFVKGRLLRYCKVEYFILSIIGVVANSFVVSKYSVTAAYYATVPFMVYCVLFLSGISFSRIVKKIDIFLGRLSYPIYLTQWLGACIAFTILPNDGYWYIVSDGLVVFEIYGVIIVFIITILLSIFLAVLVEGPIEKWRPVIIGHLMRYNNILFNNCRILEK